MAQDYHCELQNSQPWWHTKDRQELDEPIERHGHTITHETVKNAVEDIDTLSYLNGLYDNAQAEIAERLEVSPDELTLESAQVTIEQRKVRSVTFFRVGGKRHRFVTNETTGIRRIE